MMRGGGECHIHVVQRSTVQFTDQYVEHIFIKIADMQAAVCVCVCVCVCECVCVWRGRKRYDDYGNIVVTHTL